MIDYPYFRKYSDGLTYFKATSNDQFLELKIIGKYFTIQEIECKQHPERMFLNDLYECTFEHIEKISEIDFENAVEQSRQELTQFNP